MIVNIIINNHLTRKCHVEAIVEGKRSSLYLFAHVDKSPKQTVRDCLSSTTHVDKTLRGGYWSCYRLSPPRLGVKTNL